MATSGTVQAYPYNQRKVIDHAMRRAGRVPEKVSAEDIEIAQDLIFTITGQWINAGFPLWTRQFSLGSMQSGSPDLATPQGTVEVIHSYWRQLNPWRGAATLQDGSDASILFGGQASPDIAIPGAGASVAVDFGSPAQVDTIGVLPGATAPLTTTLEVQVSDDGIQWITDQTLPTTTYQGVTWTYYDLNPSVISRYVRLALPYASAPTQWVLNQLNFGMSNSYQVLIGPLNIDDYWNLPNLDFQQDQVLSAYEDRQVNGPVLKMWPVPNDYAFYNGTIGLLTRRYIQDPGSLQNAIEVPSRWLEALQWRLAKMLIFELPEPDMGQQGNYFGLMAKQQKIQAIEQEATKAEMLAWSEERSRSPIRFAPNISAYTA
jgi:hypothetical protein